MRTFFFHAHLGSFTPFGTPTNVLIMAKQSSRSKSNHRRTTAAAVRYLECDDIFVATNVFDPITKCIETINNVDTSGSSEERRLLDL